VVLRIFKMIAISGILTALERTKFVFGRGSAPDPAGGTYSAFPDSLAGLREPTSKGEGRERGNEEGNGRERRGTAPPPYANFWIRPWLHAENKLEAGCMNVT